MDDEYEVYDDYPDYGEAYPEGEEECESCLCSNGCMDCLGLSWRDFI